MRIRFLAYVLIAGCASSGTNGYDIGYNAPELVYIEPGVQVIANYGVPVFYASDYYWRYDAGTWYRSTDWRRDWIRVHAPPVAVARVEHPATYAHYRVPPPAEVRERREQMADLGHHAQRGPVEQREDSRPSPMEVQPLREPAQPGGRHQGREPMRPLQSEPAPRSDRAMTEPPSIRRR